jgi:glucose-6-phosphate isomerase
MDRQKIKTDLSNYFSAEPQADFRNFYDKTFEIVSNLYKSQNDISAMTGWLNLPHDANLYEKIKSFTDKIKEEGKYEHLVVIGIGGSSLGSQALIESINSPLWNRLSRAKRKGFLTIDFVDNLDPIVIRNVYNKVKFDKTLFLIVSKTGGTLETVVPVLIAREWFGDSFYRQCVFITNEQKGLLFELSKKYSSPLYSIPENVGGRYSVFSSVGLLPAALCGLDINEIREGLLYAEKICQERDIKINTAVSIALCAYFSYISGKNIFVLMPYSSCLRKFVEWYVQLWAESLGKGKKGSTPAVAIGATDQHSQLQMFTEGPDDKLICFLKINKHKRDLAICDYSTDHASFGQYANYKVGQILNVELDATRKALSESGKSNFLITLPELNEYYLAQVMYIFEVATSVCGFLLGINPFDQPGVELTKRYTKEALVR